MATRWPCFPGRTTRRAHPAPSPRAIAICRAGPARIYFGVESVEATLAVAVAAGASVLYPVTAVPGAGWVAEFLDSEGNCIALQGSAR